MPYILYSKISDKMAYANSADPDQTASGSTLFVIMQTVQTQIRLHQGLHCLPFQQVV